MQVVVETGNMCKYFGNIYAAFIGLFHQYLWARNTLLLSFGAACGAATVLRSLQMKCRKS